LLEEQAMLRIAVCFLGLIVAASASAQDGGEVRRGQQFATRVCAGCHALNPGQTASPQPDAPTFPVIAQVPGLTALALTVSLQGAHRRMPDLVLETQERNDVIAFILSLRRN
jgi:mono/diheme cytochrome c family protein